MKKNLFYFLAASLVVLTSCSNDDDNNNQEQQVSVILPKTMKVVNLEYPSENSNATITYNGNKIVSVSREGERIDYTYEGNFIVKEIMYDIEDDGKDSKEYEASYKYSNGKLASTIYSRNFTAEFPFGQYKGRYVYTYNADGTVKKETYSTNSQTGIEKINDYYEVFTFVNGNLVKIVATDTSSGLNSFRTSIYEYDNKNSFLKNILGYNLLLEEDESSVNNLIKHSYTFTNESVTSEPKINIIGYEYNTDGYPIKKIDYKEDGISVDEITEYTY